MKYQVQINVDNEDITFETPETGLTPDMHGLPETIQKAMMAHSSALTQEQQEHLGSVFFMLSSGAINEEMQLAFEQANMPYSSQIWQKHEYDKSMNRLLFEDVVSPHEVMGASQSRMSYSAEPIKPEKIKMEFKFIDMKKRSPYHRDEDEDSPFFGFEFLYELNTNFRITKGLVSDIIPIDGIEVIQPVSRYKMLLGFGAVFENEDEWEDVKYEIRKAVENYYGQ